MFIPRRVQLGTHLLFVAVTGLAPSLAPAADNPVTVTIDPAAGHATISPLIYGTNADIPGVPFTAFRQGGNRMTGYNWENNASNAGSDYNQQSDNYLTWVAGITGAAENTPGIVVTTFHDHTLSRGAGYSIVTLQLGGYVAADKSGPVAAIDAAPSARWIPVSFTKGSAFTTTPATSDGHVYMDEFLNFLVNRYGSASGATGVKGYDLDNEPDLWSGTHPRLHPAQPTCVELVSSNVTAAKAVKRIDAAAETFGFVSYGFGGYKDFQGAPDWNTEKAKGPYRWFIDYYLDQMKNASNTAGMRLLDVLDLHAYSEATGGGVRITSTTDWTNLDCNKARMQAPRSLWDATYIENSWIGQYYASFLPFIPNIQASIDTFYPGTKLAFTEYSFGGEGHISGGIAEADSLGIFGKKGIYLASWWQLQTDVSYIGAAFNLYRNYDGAGAKFGDTSVTSSVSDTAGCSVYTSVDSADPSRLHVILLNKSYDQPAVATIQIAGTKLYTSGRVFAFDSASASITERTAITSITGNSFSYTLPVLTAAHIVLAAAPGAPPTITTHPASTAVTAGTSTNFTIAATTTDGGTLTYQWQRNGVGLTGATSATLTLPSTQSFQAGSYTCVVSNGGTSTTSNPATLTVNAAPASSARLLNLSTRALCLTGNDALIPGFVLSGSGTKTMLIRGVGPRLQSTPFNLTGELADPQITLKSNSATIASNDNWGTNANTAAIISTSATLGAFALDSGSADAALLLDVAPGAYTVVTNGAAGGTGVAIVELYDASGTGASLVNISNRGFVSTGNNIMIPGFVVSNEGSRTFLIRAVGPTLAATPFNLSGTLADPVLTVFSGSTAILSNDDWGTGADAATTASTAATVGAFALQAGSTDAAFVVTLPPGAYTVNASGKNGGTGTALVEVYLVP